MPHRFGKNYREAAAALVTDRAYAPDEAYYGAPVVYATAPIVYGPRIAYGRPFYRPFYHARYWHR